MSDGMGVTVPADVLAIAADHIRTLGNHWRDDQASLERLVPSRHDSRMPDGTCMTCTILHILEDYQADETRAAPGNVVDAIPGESLADRHQRHYLLCGCLAQSAVCCDTDCTCGQEMPRNPQQSEVRL